MIDFTPYFPFSWTMLFVSVLVVLWGLQLFWFWKSRASGKRKAIKSLLSSWLTLVLIAFLLQPNWQTSQSSAPVLIYSNKIPKEKRDFLKDSLKVDKILAKQDYNQEGNPVYLLGQDYGMPFLQSLKGKTIHWIPDIPKGQLSFLEWKGMIRQGEIQQVSGSFFQSDAAKIELQLNGETINAQELGPSQTTFRLEFTGKIPGKNEVELLLGGERLGAIHFFVQEATPKNIVFQFGFPNPEIRFLTQYLAEKGEKVSSTTQVSQSLDVVTATGWQDSTQLVITEVSQLNNRTIKVALEQGASLLIMNLSAPFREIPMINKLLKTDFELESIGTGEQREIQNGLSAFPDRFVSKMGQNDLLEGAFAFQPTGNSKIGISLLEGTFPLLLQGDSIGYNKVWDQILGAMAVDEETNWNIPQPAFSHTLNRISLNQKNGPDEFAVLGQDTVFLQPSLINPLSASGLWQPAESGWISLNDSLDTYSYGLEEWAGLEPIKAMSAFLKASKSSTPAVATVMEARKIGDWVWLVLIMVAFGLVWLEPRV
ncbi:hypothetical protein P872_19050 [Rhodonellum psychrophilum GCM71 = DSM 17998]|uniref:Aerotolerance regulator N-terminal domain-containing protein n=2 Tax=Rhodonellum TaxID=336827 RepID=U5BWN8_9BACT|nr:MULTISPECIES: hypothetical protein [Rhodonellum]ERM82283.1 hypothetical protein P872_19050 [Rhodonellum psychrophilum GCM71 = DSM 17998]SDZ25334.1 hypothetical protein SAMN05444412_108132 [Rhodonellum ikkaensis]